jgi:hypothetical protein
MAMKNPVTRRILLRWFASGTGLVLAVFALPLRSVSRVIRKDRYRKIPEIPTRPFDESELYQPHDLAG